MTLSEKPLESSPVSSAALDELRRAHQSLRGLLNVVALSLLILTGGLSVVLLRDVSQARRQLKELTQFVENYNKTSLPAMVEIRDRLHSFARTHPAYNAMFTNYFNPASIPGPGQIPSAPPSASNASPVRLPTLPER